MSTCPKCGYCEHCKRSAPITTYPYPYIYPVYPYQPMRPFISGGYYSSSVSPNRNCLIPTN